MSRVVASFGSLVYIGAFQSATQIENMGPFNSSYSSCGLFCVFCCRFSQEGRLDNRRPGNGDSVFSLQNPRFETDLTRDFLTSPDAVFYFRKTTSENANFDL